MEEKILSRQEFEEQQEPKTEQNKKQKIRIRLLPIWLRLIIVAVLIVVMVIIGALIGYSVIGGGNPIDVFKVSTWTHIVDLVNKGA